MNEALAFSKLKIPTNVEYSPEGLRDILVGYATAFKIDEDEDLRCLGRKKFQFAYGKNIKENKYGQQKKPLES